MEGGVNLGRAQRTQQLHSTEQDGEWHCYSLILSFVALIMFLFVGGKGKRKGVETCSSGTKHSTSDIWYVCSPMSHSQTLLLDFSEEVEQI